MPGKDVSVNRCNDKVACCYTGKLTVRSYMYNDHSHNRISFTRAYLLIYATYLNPVFGPLELVPRPHCGDGGGGCYATDSAGVSTARYVETPSRNQRCTRLKLTWLSCRLDITFSDVTETWTEFKQ